MTIGCGNLWANGFKLLRGREKNYKTLGLCKAALCLFNCIQHIYLDFQVYTLLGFQPKSHNFKYNNHLPLYLCYLDKNIADVFC